MHWDESEIFKILPFYDSYIEKPKIKKLNNVELLKELPFYDKLSIAKNKTAFTIKNLFKDILVELKGFRYQITL